MPKIAKIYFGSKDQMKSNLTSSDTSARNL